jgi:hypothetical protein
VGKPLTGPMVITPPNSPSLKRGMAKRMDTPTRSIVKKPNETNQAKFKNSLRLISGFFFTSSAVADDAITFAPWACYPI